MNDDRTSADPSGTPKANADHANPESPADLDALLARASELALDVELKTVRAWKEAAPGRKAVGFMPVYCPRELIDAAGILPVALFGGGDQVEIIRGDACFQSYICHIPRSTVELALSGRLALIEFVVNDDRVSPGPDAAFALTMLATTSKGDAYTFREFSQMLHEAGFSHVGRPDVGDLPHCLVTASP